MGDSYKERKECREKVLEFLNNELGGDTELYTMGIKRGGIIEELRYFGVIIDRRIETKVIRKIYKIVLEGEIGR